MQPSSPKVPFKNSTNNTNLAKPTNNTKAEDMLLSKTRTSQGMKQKEVFSDRFIPCRTDNLEHLFYTEYELEKARGQKSFTASEESNSPQRP